MIEELSSDTQLLVNTGRLDACITWSVHQIHNETNKKGGIKVHLPTMWTFLVGKLSRIHTLRQASNSITRPCFYRPIPKTFWHADFLNIRYTIRYTHFTLLCVIYVHNIHFFLISFLFYNPERTLTIRGVNISHRLQIRHEVVHFISVGFPPTWGRSRDRFEEFAL